MKIFWNMQFLVYEFFRTTFLVQLFSELCLPICFHHCKKKKLSMPLNLSSPGRHSHLMNVDTMHHMYCIGRVFTLTSVVNMLLFFLLNHWCIPTRRYSTLMCNRQIFFRVTSPRSNNPFRGSGTFTSHLFFRSFSSISDTFHLV